MRLIESDLRCQNCGEKLSCLISGLNNELATYVCPNADFTYKCQANNQ